VLAFGSRVNDFGTPGVLEYCDMLDSPAQAIDLRRKILALALRTAGDPDKRISIGIVGAGATGVELAAELHHAFNDMHRYGGLDPASKLDITLMDMAKRVLPNVDPRTSESAEKILVRMGVKLRTGVGVDAVEDGCFHLSDGSSVHCDIQVWAAGVTGHDMVKGLGPFELSKDRRILPTSRRPTWHAPCPAPFAVRTSRPSSTTPREPWSRSAPVRPQANCRRVRKADRSSPCAAGSRRCSTCPCNSFIERRCTAGRAPRRYGWPTG
jgi:hypothetical protein